MQNMVLRRILKARLVDRLEIHRDILGKEVAAIWKTFIDMVLIVLRMISSMRGGQRMYSELEECNSPTTASASGMSFFDGSEYN